MRPAASAALLLLALALAPGLEGATAASAGGRVVNTPPEARLVGSAWAVGPQGIPAVELLGVAFDANAEPDLRSITLSCGRSSSTHRLDASALEARAPPAKALDGWKAWSGEARDGIVHFSFVLPLGAAGACRPFVSASDAAMETRRG